MDRRLLVLIAAIIIAGIVWYLVPMNGTETPTATPEASAPAETTPAPAAETPAATTPETPAPTTP